jgi:calcium channel MID1
MYFPKLSPLQSRFAGSLVATLLLVLIYLSITNPQFAYAAASPEDFGPPRPDPLKRQTGERRTEGGVVGWKGDIYAGGHEPVFDGLDQGIIRRAPPGVTALTNNSPKDMNITPGEVQYWVVENSTVWGQLSVLPPPLPLAGSVKRKRRDGFGLEDILREGESGSEADEDFDTAEDLRIRQTAPGGTRKLYITLNTCIQPSSNASGSTEPPPPLQLFVSTSPNNQKPGINGTGGQQLMQEANGGYADYTLNVTGDTYISVYAPQASSYQGIYNYEITASIDAQYHSYNDFDNLLFVDSDSNSSLLVTNDLTPPKTNTSDPIYQAWKNLSPPYVIFAHNQDDPLIKGLQRSYCGLEKYAQIAAVRDKDAVNMSMTTSVLGIQPKQQFYIKGLNRNSSYYVFLGMLGNSTAGGSGVVGGGGKVWKSKGIVTKSGGFLCAQHRLWLLI